MEADPQRFVHSDGGGAFHASDDSGEKVDESAAAGSEDPALYAGYDRT